MWSASDLFFEHSDGTSASEDKLDFLTSWEITGTCIMELISHFVSKIVACVLSQHQQEELNIFTRKRVFGDLPSRNQHRHRAVPSNLFHQRCVNCVWNISGRWTMNWRNWCSNASFPFPGQYLGICLKEYKKQCQIPVRMAGSRPTFETVLPEKEAWVLTTIP
jgi:hypothetical protein